MKSHRIVRLLAMFLTAGASVSVALGQALVFPIRLDVPPDFSSGTSPVAGTWTVLSCTGATTCPVTIQVTTSPTGGRDCRFAGVPDVIDVRSSSPKIDWTLQSGSAGKSYSFGWRPTLIGHGRAGIRIRDSNTYDEDDGTDSQPGPPLSGAFDDFYRASDTTGDTKLKKAELQKAAMHRLFYYRIHVEEIDDATGNRIRCRPHGPMILNRG